MVITLLIGNGFDIAQGAKTRYKDFYEFYRNCSPINDIEKKMIDEISGDKVDTWADLEKRLGEFTAECNEVEEFSAFYYHMLEQLHEYLDNEARIIDAHETEKFLRDLVMPEKYFSPREMREINTYIAKYTRTEFKLKCISYNYTDIFESAIGYKGSKRQLKPGDAGMSFTIENVYKVHGRLGQTPILGVNDTSQIANLPFATNDDILDYLVKPRANEILGTLIDENCATAIKDSDLIILHGLSLGVSDTIWWQLIGKRLLTSDIRVLYFYYTEEYEATIHATRQGKIKREAKSKLFDACKIPIETREKLESKVYVAINSNFLVADKKV